MKLLITGGSGFIGSNFIKYTLKRYPTCRITNLDKLTYAGHRDNLASIDHHKNYRFIQGDICDAKAVSKAMLGCDRVIHFAAESHVDRSIKNAEDFIKTNVDGTAVLLKIALKNKIKRFVHISTDEVYGSRLKGYFKEKDPLKPSSPYSASKAAADHLVLSYFITYKLPVVITRSSNNFGPFQYPEKIIPLFITNLLTNKRIPLYARGQNVRDWIFVEDNCRAIDLVLHKGKIGEIYNVAGGNALTNLNLTKKILKIMDKPATMIKRVKDRPGHDFRYAINTAKIKRLGFRPRWSFPQAIEETVHWYQHQRDWWMKRKGHGHT